MANEQQMAALRARKAHHAQLARDQQRAEDAPAEPVQQTVAQQAPVQQPVQKKDQQPVTAPTTPQNAFTWELEDDDTPETGTLAAVPVTENVPSARERELEAKIAELENSHTALSAAQQQELDRRNDELKELEDLREFKRQQETSQLLAMDGIEFESLDPEAARELSQKYLGPVLKRQQEAFEKKTQEMAKRLDEMAAGRVTEQDNLNKQQREALLARTNNEIFAVHPDFATLRQTPEFQKQLAKRIKGTSTKLSDIAATEYHAGNSKFIIDLVTQFKSGRPALEDIAGVGTSGTGNTPPTEESEPVYSSEDVTQWNTERATGKLSRDQYSKNMAKYREQRPQQPA